MVFVTFDSRNRGRTGNQIIQYLICKVFEIKFSYQYISFFEFNLKQISKEDIFICNEENMDDLLNNKNNIWELMKDKHILGDGYFQKSKYFFDNREKLLEILYNKNNLDYWIFEDNKIYIKDFLQFENNYTFDDNDLVISLRLDDFIQLPCKTSDIIPPFFYTNLLNQENFNKLYIVCDKLRWEWEYNYLLNFKKWNPIIIQGNIFHDASVIRDCKRLIHSNSTFCWIMSFFSRNKIQRFIPNTNFYNEQKLFKIEENDTIIDVKPLNHSDVFEIKNE
jgi:hypothetical protein